jgi:hypothetical protein
MKEIPKPNLRAFHEQSKAKRALFSNCEAADEVTAAHIRKMLSEPDPILKDAEAAAERGDVDELLMLLDNTRELSFVWDNIFWLKALGQYERTLLSAYVDTRLNNSHIQLSLLKFMFKLVDRDALLAAGDPLPGSEPFTVFRGVAGRGARRRKRGISWTADKDKAIWFAKRFADTGLEKPAVFRAVIPAAKVFAYYDGRDEKEFLCDIDEDEKLKKVWPDVEGEPGRDSGPM